MASVALKQGLPPVGAARPRLLILGSLPGERSLAEARYYAHPRNLFWKLLGGAIGDEMEALDYEVRLERLAVRGIALWDVVGRAERSGSLDSAIRRAEPNPLADYVAGQEQLRAIAFNGAKAATLGRRVLEGIEAALVDLPSSSPAHARMTYAAKAEKWAVLAEHAGAPPRGA
ncbi:DNA-deoxyinosine glycosylase [Sphingomicrobium nitratireducens]|uniref:DNA-deoxyinosine glycosylase n=1 Tax=Sphingomicrobium nitratireducens TaxID=2964666 RepID=UPI00223F2E66|nr:DNA-deoxyinosine glycosylase [Sphingomicrobium nitratireducens]